MSVFNFRANKVEITKEVSELDIFKKIAERENSDSLFAYIFHMADWQSPYRTYPDEIAEEKLKKSLLNGEEPDKEILEAIEFYEELSQTPSLKLLKAARRSVHKLQEYFENADPEGEEDPNKAAKDLIANVSKVGDLINKISEWEEIVSKEKDAADTRRGVKLNKYNQ